MAIQNDNTLVTKGDLKALYSDKIAPYLGANLALKTRTSDYYVQDEELLIGVWGDGRPLYRKSIVVSNILDNATTYKTVNIAHGISNLKVNGGVTVTGCWCVGDNSSGTIPTHAYNTGGSSEYLCDIFNIDSTNIVLSYKGNWTGAVLVIHIQYTKTTDAANSAIATAGCYDINFPNTWPENKEIYFGNGLYGQRFKGTENVTGNRTNKVLIPSGQNLNLINAGGKFLGGSWGYINPSNWYDSSGNLLAVIWTPRGTAQSSNGSLTLTYYLGSSFTSDYDMWVTYTK